jgi:hypothetical protein
VTPSDRIRAAWESGEYQRLAAEHATVITFAAALGMSDDALVRARKRLAGEGLVVPSYADLRKLGSNAAPVHVVPAGHMLKGVSTLVDASGAIVNQWIKTAADFDPQAALIEALACIADDWRGKAEPTPKPVTADDDLLCVYPIGDAHCGMHAWEMDASANFDLSIFERNLYAAVDHLVDIAPRAGHALIVNLGDALHSDGTHGTTTKGTRVDVDSRWPRVFAVFIRTMRRIIDRALDKHAHVTVITERGNHDFDASAAIAVCLAQFYEREPRVTIDTSPAKFHWFRFGQNLIGTTHGDTVKLDQLGPIMACDRKEDWGTTSFRYWYVGHVHHSQVKEYPGVVVETFRTLASSDAWHHGQGYRSGRDMRCLIIDRNGGEVNRHTVGIQQIARKAA